MGFLEAEPMLDSLRTDARFQDLIHRAQLASTGGR